MHHEQQPAVPGRTNIEAASGQVEQINRNEQAAFTHPQIWVGSLADYNNGDLHGDWLDAARPADEIHYNIQSVLARGSAARRGEVPEEWAIFDYEGFGSLRIGEYESIENVSRVAQAVAEYGPAFAAYAELGGLSLAEVTVDGFQEAYCGRYDSVVAYAQQLTHELGYDDLLDELPEHVRSYVRIDYEQFAHDLQVGGDISYTFTDDAGVHIFRTN